MARGWGYRIDYAAALADDAAVVALYSSDRIVALSRLVDAIATDPRVVAGEWSHPAQWSLVDIAIARPADVRRILDLSTDDLRALAVAGTDNLEAPFGGAVEGDYARGAALYARLGEVPICTESARLAIVAKARRDAARHARNRAKHGAR